MELDWFKKWREDFSFLKIILVRGNHDILKETWYREARIDVIESRIKLPPFLFTHERCEDHNELYTFCGHIHPGIYLQGLGKQALRLPCFYFGSRIIAYSLHSVNSQAPALIEPEPQRKRICHR